MPFVSETNGVATQLRGCNAIAASPLGSDLIRQPPVVGPFIDLGSIEIALQPCDWVATPFVSEHSRLGSEVAQSRNCNAIRVLQRDTHTHARTRVQLQRD